MVLILMVLVLKIITLFNVNLFQWNFLTNITLKLEFIIYIHKMSPTIYIFIVKVKKKKIVT